MNKQEGRGTGKRILRMAAIVVVFCLAIMGVAVAPASAYGGTNSPYFAAASVQCEGNNRFQPRYDSSRINLAPNYNQQDPRRFEVKVAYWVADFVRYNRSTKKNEWARSPEYTNGWKTGRYLSPTGWYDAPTTSRYDVHLGGDTYTHSFEVTPKFHRVWIKYAFRAPGKSWVVSKWLETATHENVTYSANVGGDESVNARYCDTRSRNRYVALGTH